MLAHNQQSFSPSFLSFLLADRTPRLLKYDTDYNMLWECRSLLQLQGRNCDWSMLITKTFHFLLPVIGLGWSMWVSSGQWDIKESLLGSRYSFLQLVSSCVRWYYVWLWYLESFCHHESISLRTKNQHTEDGREEREWAWIPDDMLIFCKKLGVIHVQNFVTWDNYISSLSKPLLTIILFVRVKYTLTGLAYMRDTLQRIWNLQSWELMTEVQIPTPSLRLSGTLEQVLGKRHCAKCMAGTQR